MSSGRPSRNDNPEQRIVENENRLDPATDTHIGHRTAQAVAHSQGTDQDPGAPRWKELGPRNVGGAVRSLAQDPAHNNVFYAGTAQGGLWKSTDNCASWRPIGEPDLIYPIGTIAVAPTDHRVVYVGTGEGFLSSVSGNGIFKSTDAGVSFSQLTTSHSYNDAGSWYYSRIQVDPLEPHRIWAASANGLWRIHNSSKTEERLRVSGTALTRSRVTDVVVIRHPTDPTGRKIVVLAGAVVTIAGNRQGAVFRGEYDPQTNETTWPADPVFTQTLTGRVRVAFSRLVGGQHYAYAVMEDRTLVNGSPKKYPTVVFHSSDTGVNWPPRTAGPNPATFPMVGGTSPNDDEGQCWYDLAIAVDPYDPEFVVVGHVDLFSSDDRGVTWNHILDWVRYDREGLRAYHADQHDIIFDKRSTRAAGTKKILIGNDGGISRTNDSGRIWRKVSYGITAAQFVDVTTHPSHPFIYGGGMQDNGTFVSFGGQTWYRLRGGDGGQIAFDPNNIRRFFVSSQEDVALAETGTVPAHVNQWNFAPLPEYPGMEIVPNTRRVFAFDPTTAAVFVGIVKGHPTQSDCLLMGRKRLGSSTRDAGANLDLFHMDGLPPVRDRVISGLDVNTIAHQAGNTIRYTFNEDPKLNDVKAGQKLHVESAATASNNGSFNITTVNDAADWIEVTNPGRNNADDDEAANCPATAYVSRYLDVNTIAHQAGNTIRYTFNGNPDLSDVSNGQALYVKDAATASNNGSFTITNVNDGADRIEVTNPGRNNPTDDEAANCPAIGFASPADEFEEVSAVTFAHTAVHLTRTPTFTPAAVDTLWLGTSTGKVLKLDALPVTSATWPGPDDWDDVTPKKSNTSADPNTKRIAGIAIFPGNPDIVAVSTLTWRGRVFLTHNGGQSWRRISSGLPSRSPFPSVAFEPSDPTSLYVATIAGVYVCRNLPARAGDPNPDVPEFSPTWKTYSNGLPLMQINDLEVVPLTKTLRCATHGRGAFECNVAGTNPKYVIPGARLSIREHPLDDSWGKEYTEDNVNLGEDPRVPAGRAFDHTHAYDIRVDAPHFRTMEVIELGGTMDGAEFDETMTCEEPMLGETNLVYVQVHNRGCEPASEVKVHLYCANAGALGAAPDLDKDQINFPNDPAASSAWQLAGTVQPAGTLYPGQPYVAKFEWIPPFKIVGNVALLGIVTNDQDPQPPDSVDGPAEIFVGRCHRAALRVIEVRQDVIYIRDGMDDKGPFGSIAWGGRSPDIIVKQTPAAPTPEEEFADLTDQRLGDCVKAGTNHVYVRVFNRTQPVVNVDVRLFAIPGAVPKPASEWTLIGGGPQSINGIAGEGWGVATFSWTAGATVPDNAYTLVAVASAWIQPGAPSTRVELDPGPWLVISSLDVDRIDWQWSGHEIRYTFSGAPDLRGVTVGNFLNVENAGSASNNGAFEITNIDIGAHWIEVYNPDRNTGADNEAAGSPATASVSYTRQLSPTPDVEGIDNFWKFSINAPLANNVAIRSLRFET